MPARAELVVDAVAAGDARAGVFAVLVWVEGKKAISGGVRAELGATLAGLQKAAAGTWTTSETATRLTARGATSSADVDLDAAAAAVVDKQGILHGALLLCARTGPARARPKPRAACDALLGSFELTYAEAELRRLEPK